MKKYFPLLIILFCRFTPAVTIIKLRPGPQAPPVVRGLSNYTFVPDGGQVIFTNTIQLGNTSGISFDGSGVPGVKYGFKYAGTGYVVDPGQGNNNSTTFKNWDFGNTATAVFKGDPNDWQLGRIIYDGTPQKTVFWGLFVDTFHIKGKTSLYSGTYPITTTYTNLCVGLTANNGDIENDATGSILKVSGPSIYAFHFENWRIYGPSNDTKDVGIIYVTGSGQVINFYRIDGYGYIERLHIAVLDGLPFDQKCIVKNCVDANTVLYGTVDVRIQTNEVNTEARFPILGADFYFRNNTSGNKTDRNNGYVTNAVILGAMSDERGTKFRLHLDSSFAFNAYKSGADDGSSLLKINTGGIVPLIDSVNNIDLLPGTPIPGGLLDGSYYPITGSILDQKKIGAFPKTNYVPPPGKRIAIRSVILSGIQRFYYNDNDSSQINLTQPVLIK